MSPQETTVLLSYCAGLDPWLKATGPDEAAFMAAGWSDLLGAVPLDFARSYVKRHYAHADARTIQPGDVLSGWTTERRRQETAAEQAERRDSARELHASTIADTVQSVIPAGGPTEYLEQLAAAIAVGRDPKSVPRPAGVRVLSPLADVAARRCRFHDLCACTHTECRDGWMDEETTIVNVLGLHYPAAQPCPICHDAFLMAEEQGRTRKPRAAAGRR